MSIDDTPRTREHQQDARAWATFTGGKYTAALRQMQSPLAQGLFGQRSSARKLIRTLQHHPVIGADSGAPAFGENGFYSTRPWRFDGETDYVELALITDMLRIFSFNPTDPAPDVSSYTLKHTAERFLRPHVPYVSNGRLIWAAAALGISMTGPDQGSPNVLIAVPEREHDYVSRASGDGRDKPRAHHYRPAGYEHLHTALAQLAAGEPVDARWVKPAPQDTATAFHAWLIGQAGREDPVGDLASDYAEAVRSSLHRTASTPDELLTILSEVTSSSEAHEAARNAIAEWAAPAPLPQPFLTELITASTNHHLGWGAGDGDVERYEYRCPCGEGTIIEEHDNIPGFREHDVRIDCVQCRSRWRFVDGRSVRDWRLEPATPGSERP